MILDIHTYELKLAHPFTIARSTSTSRQTLIVELRQTGKSGFGEAVDYPYYGATIENTKTLIEGIAQQIKSTKLDNPLEFNDMISACLGIHNPSEIRTPATFALCALDEAAHDLWGKLNGRPLWKIWGLDINRAPQSSYTIGIDSIEVMIKKMKQFDDFGIYKIKLGTDNDIEIVRRLRDQTDAVFRVDANCGWSADQAIEYSYQLKDLGVEFIEQPLSEDDIDGMSRVYEKSALPCLADESCQVESDVEKCSECFHGINIKLEKCGGLTAARRMIARARQLGMKVMVGCFTQSSVAISAVAQLLPMVDYADIDGAILIAEDIASGVRIESGRVKYPDTAGCGVELLRS